MILLTSLESIPSDKRVTRSDFHVAENERVMTKEEIFKSILELENPVFRESKGLKDFSRPSIGEKAPFISDEMSSTRKCDNEERNLKGSKKKNGQSAKNGRKEGNFTEKTKKRSINDICKE